ncbi:MAG TPA: hypothetical protein P5531_01310 [Bacteroidales bacterium]|nr:hypothetical protein [Bacteroidales bacterium]HSA42292.1 hypothetical protein [Bacteroidales bacterium]
MKFHRKQLCICKPAYTGVSRLFFLFLFSFSFYLPSKKAAAQCCSAGNPSTIGFQQDKLEPNQLKLGLSYKYSFSDQYYHLDHAVAVPNVNFNRFHFTSLYFRYGIAPKLNVYGELGYFIDKSQSVSVPVNHLISGKGIGDLELNLQYALYQQENSNHQVSMTAGLKIPVGVFDQVSDGIVLPLSLQPSNGALKYNAGLIYFFKKPFSKWSFVVSGSADITTRIISRNFFYKYGNLYVSSVSGYYRNNLKTSISLQTRFEFRDKDKRENHIRVESSGGFAVYGSIKFSYRFYKLWEIQLQPELPVYKYVDGYQITNRFSLFTGVTKKFNKLPNPVKALFPPKMG